MSTTIMAYLPESFSQLLLYVALAFPVYCVTIIFYNLYLHPLRHFPGSPLYTSTPFPRLYLNVSGLEPQTVLEQHLRYGPIIRTAPNELSFTTATAWKDIYGFKSKARKDWTMYALSEPTKKSVILASKEDHPRQRKMLAPAFGDRALKMQEPMLTTYTSKMVEVLKKKMAEGSDIDMAKVFNCVTFDTIADMVFGEPLGLCEDLEYNHWLTQLFSSIWLAGSSRALQHFPLLFKLAQQFIPKSVQEIIDSSFQNTVSRVDKRLAMKTDRPDIFGLMMKHKEEGADMTMAELYANADLLMIAGTETTATSLSGLTYSLLTHPSTLEKLTREIRTSFPHIDDITMEKLPRLPYLSACLEEGMRCFPAVPEGIRRQTPSEGATISGHYIPANIKVSIPHYAAYHLPTNFIDPKTFAPERWFKPDSPDHSPRYDADKKEVLQPFSVGPRNCVGLSLAYHEMRLVMANLLWHFDIEMAEKTDEKWLEQTVHLVWDKKPLYVKLSPRKD